MEATLPASGHPADGHEPEVDKLQWRARSTMAVLVAAIGWNLFSLLVLAWRSLLMDYSQIGDEAQLATKRLGTEVAAVAYQGQRILLLITAAHFLLWVYQTVRLAGALGRGSFAWTPAQAVIAFFLPVVNLVRPFYLLCDLRDRLAPELVPEPAERVADNEETGYREVKVERPPPPIPLPRLPIRAWWFSFWTAPLLLVLASLAAVPLVFAGHAASAIAIVAARDAFQVISAALTICMVRGLTARVLERFRRLSHNPPEMLLAAGIDLTPSRVKKTKRTRQKKKKKAG